MANNKSDIWTVLADGSRCRIYEFNRKEKTLILVKELLHPETKLKGFEHHSDKPGRYKMPRNPLSAYEPKDPQKVEMERFASLIAHELEAGRNAERYENLVFIIPPKMSGLLNATLNKHVQACVVENIHKDYIDSSEGEIIKTLQGALRRPKF